jgi:hypothetical protein
MRAPMLLQSASFLAGRGPRGRAILVAPITPRLRIAWEGGMAWSHVSEPWPGDVDSSLGNPS